jgi:hypothetical protein
LLIELINTVELAMMNIKERTDRARIGKHLDIVHEALDNAEPFSRWGFRKAGNTGWGINIQLLVVKKAIATLDSHKGEQLGQAEMVSRDEKMDGQREKQKLRQ